MLEVEKFVLTKDNSVFLIIDIQDKLAAAMSVKEKVIENTLHIVELAKTQNIPMIVTEQYPKGLGETVAEIKAALPDYNPLEKITFNCCSGDNFIDSLKTTNRNQIIVAGMETHICVLQTVLGLLAQNYYVHVVSDAVCSRYKQNWKTGLGFMRDAGAIITSTETVLFQLLEKAGTEEFKMISRRIK